MTDEKSPFPRWLVRLDPVLGAALSNPVYYAFLTRRRHHDRQGQVLRIATRAWSLSLLVLVPLFFFLGFWKTAYWLILAVYTLVPILALSLVGFRRVMPKRAHHLPFEVPRLIVRNTSFRASLGTVYVNEFKVDKERLQAFEDVFLSGISAYDVAEATYLHARQSAIYATAGSILPLGATACAIGLAVGGFSNWGGIALGLGILTAMLSFLVVGAEYQRSRVRTGLLEQWISGFFTQLSIETYVTKIGSRLKRDLPILIVIGSTVIYFFAAVFVHMGFEALLTSLRVPRPSSEALVTLLWSSHLFVWSAAAWIGASIMRKRSNDEVQKVLRESALLMDIVLSCQDPADPDPDAIRWARWKHSPFRHPDAPCPDKDPGLQAVTAKAASAIDEPPARPPDVLSTSARDLPPAEPTIPVHRPKT